MQRSDDDKLLLRIQQRFHKACADYALIEEGDRILVGVSGGKDSLALMELMGNRAKILKPHFEVEAVHVKMTNIPYSVDEAYLTAQAERVGVRMHVCETQFDASTDKRHTPCFLCSWNRRKAMFEKAKELGCNKIALGHHMDDILVTLLMNMTFQGAYGTMPPKLKMDKFDMTVIRPLCRVGEEDLARMAEIRGYMAPKKQCPYEDASHRNAMKRILGELEKMNPEARYNMWGAMTNIQRELLPNEVKLQVEEE